MAFQVYSFNQPTEEVTIAQTEVISAPEETVLSSSLQLSAQAYVVFNLKSGKVLLQKNEDKLLPIASITKLFTATALSNNFNLESTTTINWTDINAEGEAGRLKYGQVYSYHELLFPLLLESSNDAAEALDRATKGELLKSLNTLAANMEARNTKFTDTSGLQSGDVSTATDLKKLITYVYENEKHVLDITKLPKYLNNKNGWVNNNPVYSQPGYRGGKHGYTEQANRTAVAIFDETIQDESQTIGYIVLGSSNIKEDVKTLRDFITKK